MIFFSVILPNYNHESYLNQRIQSIIHQTYQNFELIILDDASTDNSKEIIEKYRNHPLVSQIVYNAKNSGSPFKQWQQGIELAQGDWIWIAESDDLADEKFLQSAVNTFNQLQHISLFYTDSFIDYRENMTVHFSKASEKYNHLFKTNKWNSSYVINGKDELNTCLKFYCTIINVSSVVFKRNVGMRHLDGLQNFKYHGDWLFYIRLCLEAEIFYLNQPLNLFKRHTNSHLIKNENENVSKVEKFRILNFLYSNDKIESKNELLNYFVVNYLSFGFLKNNLASNIKILKGYWAINKILTIKFFLQMLKVKYY